MALHELWNKTAPEKWDGEEPAETEDEEKSILADGPRERKHLEKLLKLGYARRTNEAWAVTRQGELRLLDPEALLVEEVHRL